MLEPKMMSPNYTVLLKDCTAATLANIENLMHDFASEDVNLYDMFMHMWRLNECNTKDEDDFYLCVADVYYLHKNYYLQLKEAYEKEFDYATGITKTTHRVDGTTRHTEETENTKKNEAGVSNTVSAGGSETSGSNSRESTSSEENNRDFVGAGNDGIRREEYAMPNKQVNSEKDGYLTSVNVDGVGRENNELETINNSGSSNESSEMESNISTHGEQESATNVDTSTDRAKEYDASLDYESDIETTHNDLFLEQKQKYIEQLRDLYNEFARRFSDCFLHIYS